MTVVAYDRLRMLWGALDWQHGTNHPYTAAQTKSGGDSAVAVGGIGIRRVECTIDRATQHAGADPAVMHFDILNMTSSAPDDTWTTTDYTQSETALSAFFTSVAPFWSTGYKLTTFNWYRIGDGVTKPNPAERQLLLTTPIAGSSSFHTVPPQSACSITFRTAVRRSWGRTYLPIPSVSLSAAGVLSQSNVDTITGAANTLVTALAANDLHLVVYSAHLHATLNVEHVEADDVVDIIRRRRWKTSTYKKILP